MVDRLTHLPFRSILPCERITPNSALSLAQVSSVPQRSAASCGVRCRAMLCGAFSFVLTRYHTNLPGTRICTYVESHQKAHPPQLTSASSEAQRSAVRCRAVRCCAVRCLAVRCCAVLCRPVQFLFLPYIPGICSALVDRPA